MTDEHTAEEQAQLDVLIRAIEDLAARRLIDASIYPKGFAQEIFRDMKAAALHVRGEDR